jgi:N4-gp56 family major capsid protein
MAGLTTTTEIAGPVNVDFQVELLRNAQALCVYFQGSEAATIAEHSGTFTAKWRRIENLTPRTTPLAELTGSVSFPTRTSSQPTVTDVTATVQKFGDFIFLNEEVDLINFNGQTQKLMKVLGIQAGRSLNRLQRNVLEDDLTAVLAATTGTSATDTNTANLSISNMAVVVNVLNNNVANRFTAQTTGAVQIGTAPIRSAYWGFIHHDTEEDVRLLTGFQAVETYAGQTETAVGEIGTAGGIRYVSSPEASIDLGAGNTVTGTATGDGRSSGEVTYDLYNSVVIGEDAHGSLGLSAKHVKEIYRAGDDLPAIMVMNTAKGSAGSADPLGEVGTLGWKSWHAGVILNSDWGRVIRHTASKLDTL